jgi:hypothetical protein
MDISPNDALVAALAFLAMSVCSLAATLLWRAFEARRIRDGSDAIWRGGAEAGASVLKLVVKVRI